MSLGNTCSLSQHFLAAAEGDGSNLTHGTLLGCHSMRCPSWTEKGEIVHMTSTLRNQNADGIAVHTYIRRAQYNATSLSGSKGRVVD